MSFSLEHYVESLQDFQSQTKRLMAVFRDIGVPAKADKVASYREELQNDQFNITVVGEFGRGKSMFINALLGKKILPSSPLVTTTVLNHITYGEKEEVVLRFEDENTPEKVISLEEFQQIVAPLEVMEEDKQGQKEYDEAVNYIESIAYAEVRYPIDFCKDGVRIIDTPGLNDGNATRDRLASEIIPRSDVAILLLTAKSPLSASEMTMLKDRLLKNDIQKVFLVANFKDAIRTEQDEREVIEYIRENLQGIIDEPKIFLVSAKQGLTARRLLNGEKLRVRKSVPIEETGVPEFEQSLADFLQYERAQVKMKRPVHKTLRLIDDTIEQEINIARRSLELEKVGLEAKITQIQTQLKSFKENSEKSLSDISGKLKIKEKELMRWYKDELVKIKQAGMHEFDRHTFIDETTITGEVEEAMAPLERRLHEQKVEKMQNTAKEVIESGSKNTNQQWLQIDTQFNQLIETGDDTRVTINSMPAQPDYDIFDDIYAELDVAWSKSTSLLGKAVIGVGYMVNTVASGITSFFKSLFGISENEKRRKLRSQLSNQLESNRKNKASAFKKEWQAVVKGIESNYRKTVEQMVREKAQQLALLTKNAQMEKSEVENRLAEIREQERSLQQIQQELQQLVERMNIRNEKEVFG
ncbi:dynamin family protein [Sediminibacillus massiliensis]|uniref:dynamin family protein n=1 Tax=Sediminibacillus massiliensis TaxID=1926277 RepID=UPI0009887131|nr:dynamin family protein [Sediminibacillus massiliensis]